jgi:hypothetical protein
MIQETGWQRFLAFTDQASAAVVAGYLVRNNCPARAAFASPGLDLSPSVEVLVPGELLHRARWLWAQAELSDNELAYLSTGQLPGLEQEPEGE